METIILTQVDYPIVSNPSETYFSDISPLWAYLETNTLYPLD